MKLLAISHLFPNPEFPMFGVFVLRQLERLTELGVEVRIISPIPFTPRILAKANPKWQAYHNIPAYNQIGNIHILHPRYLRPPGRWFRPFSGASMYASILPVVKKLRTEFKFEAVLANSIIPDGDAVLRLSQKFRVPGFCYAIGDDVLTHPHENFLTMRKTQSALQNLAGIISHGNGLKAEINKLIGDASHVKTIYRGCNLSVFKPDREKRSVTRSRLGLTEDETLVLFTGYLQERKGIAEIMPAMSNLFQRHACLRMLFVGENMMEQQVNEWLSNETVHKRVMLAGAQAHHDLPDFYNAADIFILPSHWEGTPNALVEAAACGLPIVSTKIPGAQEILGGEYENFLVCPHDSVALEKKIEELTVSEKLRKEYGKIALSRVQSYFNAKENAKILRDFFFSRSSK